MTKLPKLFSYSVALIVSLFMWMYIVEGVKAGIKLYLFIKSKVPAKRHDPT